MEILSLGEKIKRKRKELNMTLKDLAKDRITPGQISLVESGRSNPSMDLLEYLASNLNTTVEYLMESEESQAERISKYYEQVSEAYLLSGNYLKSETYIEQAFDYASKYNLEFRKAKIKCLKAEVLKLKGRLYDAQCEYLDAIILLSKLKKNYEIVIAFLSLGKISLEQKQYLSANNYFKQAELVYSQNNIENEHLIGEIYYNIAKVNQYFENSDESKRYAYLADGKFRRVNNKKEYANSLLLLSEEKRLNGDIANAIKYSNKALSIFKEINSSYNICNIENDLGKLFYNFQDINQSEIHYISSIKNSEYNNNQIDILINLCKTKVKMKNIQEAEKMLVDLYGKVDKNDAERLIALNIIKYRIFTINDKLDEAENIIIKSYNLAKEKDKLKIAGQLSILISKFYMEHKREELAKKFLDEGVRIFRNVGLVSGNTEMRNVGIR
jgi:transcriptional regulator with XRE-family HTH domain